ncbi:MAG TPA: hypothetical protein VKC54_03145 [Patescibacteria group bacterium]|nr:hypothetical protein [Patescibacteria group bacterium]
MKERQDTDKRLTVADFENPFFDRQKIRLRTVYPKNFHLDDIVNDLAQEMADDEGLDGEIDPFLKDTARDMLEFEADLPQNKKRQFIEGTTYTDGFNLIGFTYSIQDSSISIVNKDNEILFKGFIYTPEEYEKALKKADGKQDRLWDKKRS